MNGEQKNLADAKKDFQNSLRGTEDHTPIRTPNTLASKTLIIAPLLTSIIFAVIFLIASRSNNDNDPSGLSYSMLILETGSLFAVTLIVTFVCVSIGIYRLKKAEKINHK